MEERNYGINWIGLFIKVIVFVIVALFAIWLITKVVSKNKGLSFDENNKLFTDATVEYFKDNLPKEDSSKVTLKELIEKDYLKKLINDKGKACDINKSVSEITLLEDYYSIKSTLICGNESKTTYTKLGNETCDDCDIKVEGLEIKQKEEKDENSTSENVETKPQTNTNTNVNNEKPAQTILYEYVKENIEYSDWYVGKATGANIENSTKDVSYSKYCKMETHTYRTVSYSYVKEPTTYTYKLELKNLNNAGSVSITDHGYFDTYNDHSSYLNSRNQDLQISGGNPNAIAYPSLNELINSDLDRKNFNYEISKVYEQNGKYYVDITVEVKNVNGVTPYYNYSIKRNVYFVPIKFSIMYYDANNCETDKSDNWFNYSGYMIPETWSEKLDVYRYKNKILEYTYSSESYLEGYTKTGNTKLAS